MRDSGGLTRLLRQITESGEASSPLAPVTSLAAVNGGAEPGGLDLEAVEAANLRVVSLLIVAGARRRAESRGCHRRRDAAATATVPSHTLARWDGRRLAITREPL
jgi:L-aspartate oxidase